MILRFPRAWLWLVDEIIPSYVKKQYSPRDSWKDKPFSKEDAHFFFKGIDDLSELFTEERPKGMPAYFAHPKYRSSYLLYFLPLQAAKFLTLFESHTKAIDAAIHQGQNSGVLRIADLGVGPGTASISFLLTLLERATQPTSVVATSGASFGERQKKSVPFEIPKIELYWFDTQDSIMKDGIALVEQISNQFPKLRGRVTIHTSQSPWWKAASELPHGMSLIFMGHVLNESAPPQHSAQSVWRDLVERASGGGILMVEPASRKTSQQIAKIRDQLFANEFLPAEQQSIWGPCLHAGTCPLAEGRDWCHFSDPLQIPGKWFKDFSKGLGSERLWVKYSYLWLAAKDYPSTRIDPKLRRVISDPLSKAVNTQVLICEPEVAEHWPVNLNKPIRRGDIIRKSNP